MCFRAFKKDRTLGLSVLTIVIPKGSEILNPSITLVASEQADFLQSFHLSSLLEGKEGGKEEEEGERKGGKSEEEKT